MPSSLLRLLHRKLPLIVGGFPKLWTERLLLRQFEVLRDSQRFVEYRSDPEVGRYLAQVVTKQDAMSVLCAYRAAVVIQRRHIALAIERLADGRLVGEVAISSAPADPTTCILGFILHRDCWGSGYATEAARCLIDYAFRDLHFATVIAGCTPENVASRRVLEKLYFAPCAPREDMPGIPEGVSPLFFSIRADADCRPV